MTSRQLHLLKFIRNKIVHSGTGPTFKEMRLYMGVGSNQTIDDFLSVLAREGYIKITQSKQRGIELTDKSQQIEVKYQLEQPNAFPQVSMGFVSNASTPISIGTQNVGHVDLFSNKTMLLKKEDENNGTS